MSVYQQAVEQTAAKREAKAARAAACPAPPSWFGPALGEAMLEDALIASRGDYSEFCKRIEGKIKHAGGDDCSGCGKPGCGRFVTCEQCYAILYGANKHG